MSQHPAIVVLTNTRDLAADDVIRRLTESHHVIRLNADREVPGPLWNLQQDVVSIGAVWWRQFELWPNGSLVGAEIDDLLVTRSQWRAWLSTLDNGSIPWINPIWNARRAENKVDSYEWPNHATFRFPKR